MKTIGVIPARYHASRLPGKVLEKINGKPMVELVYEAAKRASLLDDLIVVTDDDRIMRAVGAFGGKTVLSKKEHQTGTDRIAEAVSDIDVKVVVNIQADEPFVQPAMIDCLIKPLLTDPKLNMTTLMKRAENREEFDDPHSVKIVTDKNGFALYFSRGGIPYYDSRSKPLFYKHIGIYAYTKEFLSIFTKLPVSNLERIEKLEQLRVLENGYRIKAIETQYDTIGVDTLEDLEKVRKKAGC